MDELGLGYHQLSVQIIGIVFSLFLTISVFFLVKARRIQEKYSLIWFFVGVFIFIISAFKGLLEKVSRLIGIYYAPSALFAILISCSYLLLLNMSITNSTLKKQNKSLIQEIGLLKMKVDELEKKIGGKFGVDKKDKLS